MAGSGRPASSIARSGERRELEEEALARGHLSRPIPGLKVNAFLEDEAFTPILKDLIVQSSLPLRAVETVFAPDSSGFGAT